MSLRVSYLGPKGTFTDEALRAAAAGEAMEAVPARTIFDAILSVEAGVADRAFVPIENSIEGTVRSTLDTLAFDAPATVIVGEFDLPVTHDLLARAGTAVGDVRVVLSHPQGIAQCARFLRERLPDADIRTVSSTAEAARLVGESAEPWAALGSAAAGRLYGCETLVGGVEDADGNVTRFVWLAREGTPAGEGERWRTSFVFAELGDDHPGALVDALLEFSGRDVNLTRIESRPLRRGLGRYMFFCDLEGSAGDRAVADALDALRTKAESVRLLGSYPVHVSGIPGAPA